MKMKNFVTFTEGFLLVVGIIFLIVPVHFFPAFYDVRYMGISAVAGALIIFFLPLSLRVSPQHADAQKKNHAADIFQSVLTVVILNNAVGDLGLYELYKVGFQFDKVIHFITPLLSVYFLTYILQERFSLSVVHSLRIALVTILTIAILWEFYEYAIDYFMATHLYGVYGTDVFEDTFFDVLCGVAGSFTGFFLAKKQPSLLQQRFHLFAQLKQKKIVSL